MVVLTEEVTILTRAEEIQLLRAQVKRLRKQIRALLTVIELKDGPRSLDEDEDRAALPILDHIHRATQAPGLVHEGQGDGTLSDTYGGEAPLGSEGSEVR